MTDSPSDRTSSTQRGTRSEPQSDWLPIARAVFRLATAQSERPEITETIQNGSDPLIDNEAFEKFKERLDKSIAGMVRNQAAPVSLHNLRTTLRDKARTSRAEIDLAEGYFKFFFDLPSGGVACTSFAPWHLSLPLGVVAIEPGLQFEALTNKGNGFVRIGDEEVLHASAQAEAVHAATSFVWNQSMLPVFGRLVSAGRVRVYARVGSRLAQFEPLPAGLWSVLTLDDWMHGTARDPEGVRYYSLYAEDSLPKTAPLQASNIASETAATNALAAELVVRPDLSRVQASNYCKTKGYDFSVKGRPFLHRIWPDAREKAGLPKLATAGRKKSTR